MTEPEITETEISEALAVVEAEEVRDAAAVLAKNKGLLADLAKLKSRAGHLEELARTLGVADADLADPRAFVAKRAEERKAADTRARAITENALRAIAAEGRLVKGSLDEVLAKLVANPDIKADGKEGLDAALWELAPRRPSPVPPPPGGVTNWRDSIHYKPTVKDFAELQAQGPEAVARFAESNPGQYAALRADFERQLANPGARR